MRSAAHVLGSSTRQVRRSRRTRDGTVATSSRHRRSVADFKKSDRGGAMNRMRLAPVVKRDA
ncbi:hypothetical protein RGR602_PA00030 (plasmid) [Rhizobium gallicum bv. gallicum R602sp]|uniref:Uncharacterized protein n=1 Tax=Rhizobium gallicum bv. gallicum R602sp TaxID=1041138 RepID=A0A0B4XA04_9HYPH|nr:hypothetical protein RGR602_PA00030 [Rhizobium gallicum bv. gallicum R602sp]